MVRIAKERIDDLLALAEEESAVRSSKLPDRYVALARKVGMRYNVRLVPEYRELYCRGCSSFWVEGRTVRTRLRSGRRVRTCLVCGRHRRTRIGAPAGAGSLRDSGSPRGVALEEGALTGPVAERFVETFREPGSEED
jgi:ribonuclease P protein subunit RPR2